MLKKVLMNCCGTCKLGIFSSFWPGSADTHFFPQISVSPFLGSTADKINTFKMHYFFLKLRHSLTVVTILFHLLCVSEVISFQPITEVSNVVHVVEWKYKVTEN